MTEKQKTQLRRKWKRWLKQISADLANLLTSNDVFKEIRRMVAKNKQIQSPALIHAWINKNYADSIAIGIRRLNDHDKRSISLYRLIEDISKNSGAITRNYYVSRYRKWMREDGFADRDFNIFANKRDSLIRLSMLKRDMKKLDKDTDRIRKFVNKRVAHCDLHRKKQKKTTYKDIDSTLQDIDELFCKYNLLVTRGGMTTAKPIIGFDWRKPLRYAWIEDDKQKQ